MDLDRLASWLRCPSCGSDLRAVPPLVLRCEHGHTVDGNKRGYANLLASGTRVTGDTAEMLAARGTFLDRGHYAPLVDALTDATVAPHEPASDAPSRPAVARSGHREAGLRIVDAGCGTGHYLRAVLDAVPGSTGLAADLSPAAVAIAVRGRPDVDGVVADTWAALPMRDGVADLILDVFAPRNLPEFHRVLARAAASRSSRRGRSTSGSCERQGAPSASRRTSGRGSSRRPTRTSRPSRRPASDGSCASRRTTSGCCWVWVRPPITQPWRIAGPPTWPRAAGTGTMSPSTSWSTSCVDAKTSSPDDHGRSPGLHPATSITGSGMPARTGHGVTE
ncbi:23S rRNA (guanine(748)-N(1))-methyltransferase [Clavibacter michiganensis subsp. michiganensis]|uniref:23S rRNA (Guanine(748)-N(1))-methyltransferase n=1 Tax=Clavibacter michiganensis subsp. michiganensis TaxID=33013 RepID=A0A251XHT6_CLAMM|nr:23S rRNA (guanine(748)-N(1))-methyltransferase [Clavibacter michiganensis subsp. michiganensis]OUE02645.1 23S rRNA (guanine(748)-N(1))-methyltransferase [Clavibacter michiganensis subsp. michiganensis]